MTYQYDVKINGVWYKAGEEISPVNTIVAEKQTPTINVKVEQEKSIKRGRPRKD